MNRFISIYIFAFLSALCFVTANAEPLPRWVKKGVTELDKKRTNRSYGFHIFHEEDQNKTIFELNRFKPPTYKTTNKTVIRELNEFYVLFALFSK